MTGEPPENLLALPVPVDKRQDRAAGREVVKQLVRDLARLLLRQQE